MIHVGWFLCGMAIIVLVIAALGVLRLPDALARQHAATKAATLAVSMFAIGLAMVAMASGWGWAWLWRLALVVTILLLTLPLASHALVRAGVTERRHTRSDSAGAGQPDFADLPRNEDDV